MKSKKTKMNPAEALGNMQRSKMGVAKGSYLEGGTIVYDDDKKKKKKNSKKTKPPIPGTISNVDLNKVGKNLKGYWDQFKDIMKTPIIK